MVGFLVGFLDFQFIEFEDEFRHVDWDNQLQHPDDVFERLRGSSGCNRGCISRHFWSAWWSDFWSNFGLPRFLVQIRFVGQRHHLTRYAMLLSALVLVLMHDRAAFPISDPHRFRVCVFYVPRWGF